MIYLNLKIFFFLDAKYFFLKGYKQGIFENNTKPDIFLGYSLDSPGHHRS